MERPTIYDGSVSVLVRIRKQISTYSFHPLPGERDRLFRTTGHAGRIKHHDFGCQGADFRPSIRFTLSASRTNGGLLFG